MGGDGALLVGANSIATYDLANLNEDFARIETGKRHFGNEDSISFQIRLVHLISGFTLSLLRVRLVRGRPYSLRQSYP